LNAEIVNARLVLYRATENIPSRLSPLQRLLISYLTSILNASPHCASAARTPLSDLEGGAAVIRALDSRDYESLPAPEAALAGYVEKLTCTPGEMTETDIAALRAEGFEDLEILDANNQCAHLNYTNRVANGLGLLSEAVREERSRDRVPQ
jgi:uncharacterized peroxidase-related enzyme